MVGWPLKPLAGCFPHSEDFFLKRCLPWDNKWVPDWLDSLLHQIVSRILGGWGTGKQCTYTFLDPVQPSVVGLRPCIPSLSFFCILSFLAITNLLHFITSATATHRDFRKHEKGDTVRLREERGNKVCNSSTHVATGDKCVAVPLFNFESLWGVPLTTVQQKMKWLGDCFKGSQALVIKGLLLWL